MSTEAGPYWHSPKAAHADDGFGNLLLNLFEGSFPQADIFIYQWDFSCGDTAIHCPLINSTGHI